jgi:hypothetical protein
MSDNKVSGLALMRVPFSDNQISLLPKPLKKDSPKSDCKSCGGYHGQPAIHLEYVGHAALTDRLLECDPYWTWEPLHLKDGLPAYDNIGGLWIKLTVCNVTRLGYGNAEESSYKEIGSREKEVIGDALRNASMRFGAALDLWHKGDLHSHKEQQTVDKPVESRPVRLREPTITKLTIIGIEGATRLIREATRSGKWTSEQVTKYISSKYKTDISAIAWLDGKEFLELAKTKSFLEVMGGGNV